MNFPLGYTGIENSNPTRISELISYISLQGGTTSLINSSDFNSPTGSTWANSPISINAEPSVQPTNLAFVSDQIIKASIMNQQTKMFGSNFPYPFNQRVYVYGNSQNRLDYQMQIPLNFGGSSYNLAQIGLFENALINNANSKLIEVYDMGSGPFTGLLNLTFILSTVTGVYNLGIRLESTTNVSSIFWLQIVVLNPNIGVTSNFNPYLDTSFVSDGAEVVDEKDAPVATVGTNIDVRGVANSNNSTMITRKGKKKSK